MNPANAALLTAVVVLAGRWSRNQSLDIRTVVGGIVMLLFLAVLPPKLGKQFGLLIFAAALFTYGESITKKLPLKAEQVKAGGGKRNL